MSLEICMLIFTSTCAAPRGVADTPFVQEYHVPHVLAGGATANDVRAVTVDRQGNVWVATRADVFQLRKDKNGWTAMMPAADAGPAYDVIVDNAGTVWAGAWNGLYRAGPNGLTGIDGIDAPISVLCLTRDGVVAAGPDGQWRVNGTQVTPQPMACARSIRDLYADGHGALWIATGRGLYYHTESGGIHFHARESLLSADVRAIADAGDDTLWIGGLGGVNVYRKGGNVGAYTPAEGLPSVDVRAIARSPDGVMWVGTALGVVRYDGSSWSLRHSRRWLVDDEVRDVAFDADGTAWVATAGGVSAIRRRNMTLADKAEHYESILLKRHVREPGFVEKCILNTPGDVRTHAPRDDDNDGQYTAMYLVGESFRYAATRDPKARVNARRAFDALHFLRTVTDADDFVARTVIPADWTRMNDPNEEISDRMWAERHVRDPRNKRVPVRWRLSRDGKWKWKCDTSSDEITGHYFGYLFYYDLVAEETERRRVAEHVRRITDRIIDDGFTLKDLDGTHTRWAVWSPEKLNHDPDWATERGINSVEILAFLKTAHHMTGDAKYDHHYRTLIDKHGYADNALRAKTVNPSWRTHIDDELLALAYPALLLYEDDPALKKIYRKSLDLWFAEIRTENSPFFNFLYGGLIGEDPELDGSIAFLRDMSLDLVQWTVDNARREDLQLVHEPEIDRVQTHRLPPPSERGVMRWDKNPWDAVQGDGGHTESDGAFWLLPYWMGRYYGFIEPSR